MINFHTHHPVKFGIQNIDNVEKCNFNPKQFYALGSHPWFKKINIELLENTILNHSNIISIGECGLDKVKSYYPLKKQIDILKQQIELSEHFKLPLTLHIVNAFNEIVALKKQIKPKQKWVIHGFNKYKLTETLLDNGFYLSFGKALMSNQKLQNSFKTVPNHKVLLETDDSDVKIENLYAFVADLKSFKLQDLTRLIRENIKTITNGKLA